jgi:hypothetical protein
MKARGHWQALSNYSRRVFQHAHLFLGGSFANATSISGYSSVDYFACMPLEHQFGNSGLILEQVTKALKKQFPHAHLPMSCPAIQVYFAPSEETAIIPGVTVIPAYYIKSVQGCAIYEVPDCSSYWMLWSPEAHKTYIHIIDQKHGGKLKGLIRLIKAWKYYQGVDISSFYLEMVTAKYAERRSALTYSTDVRAILD